MAKTEITYNQLFKAAQEYLVQEDKELYLNPRDVTATSKLSDLHFDDAVKIQLIKYVEEKFNIPQVDDDEIDYRKYSNLGEFCRALFVIINRPDVKKENPQTREEVFSIINKHLYEHYGIYFAKPISNWSKDFGLKDFDIPNFYDWVQRTFSIELPYFYFKDLNALCDIVWLQINKKKEKQKLKLKQQQFKESIKLKAQQTFNKVVNLFKSHTK